MCLLPQDKKKENVEECCTMCYQYKQCTYEAFEVGFTQTNGGATALPAGTTTPG